jgi:hypothetical protein
MEHFEGHGNRWQALGGEAAISKAIPLATSGGALLWKRHMMSHTLGKHADVLALVSAELSEGREAAFQAILVGDEAEAKFELWSVFPRLAGRVAKFEILQAVDWSNEIEGNLALSTPSGTAIGLYDADFAVNRRSYPRGAVRSFAVAGLAMSLRPPDTDELELSEGPFYERVLEGMARDNPNLDRSSIASIIVPLAGKTLLAPTQVLDEFALRFPAPAPRQADLHGESLLVLDVEIEPGGLTIPVYAPPAACQGFVPEPGQDVEALVWLIGWMTGE